MNDIIDINKAVEGLQKYREYHKKAYILRKERGYYNNINKPKPSLEEQALKRLSNYKQYYMATNNLEIIPDDEKEKVGLPECKKRGRPRIYRKKEVLNEDIKIKKE